MVFKWILLTRRKSEKSGIISTPSPFQPLKNNPFVDLFKTDIINDKIFKITKNKQLIKLTKNFADNFLISFQKDFKKYLNEIYYNYMTIIYYN